MPCAALPKSLCISSSFFLCVKDKEQCACTCVCVCVPQCHCPLCQHQLAAGTYAAGTSHLRGCQQQGQGVMLEPLQGPELLQSGQGCSVPLGHLSCISCRCLLARRIPSTGAAGMMWSCWRAAGKQLPARHKACCCGVVVRQNKVPTPCQGAQGPRFPPCSLTCSSCPWHPVIPGLVVEPHRAISEPVPPPAPPHPEMGGLVKYHPQREGER